MSKLIILLDQKSIAEYSIHTDESGLANDMRDALAQFWKQFPELRLDDDRVSLKIEKT